MWRRVVDRQIRRGGEGADLTLGRDREIEPEVRRRLNAHEPTATFRRGCVIKSSECHPTQRSLSAKRPRAQSGSWQRGVKRLETTIFIELKGASGARYRFLPASQTQPSVMAGNLVVAEHAPEGLVVLLVGVTNDLSRSQRLAREAGLGDKPLFVRLNVARRSRDQEHEDIVAQYAPPKVIDDA